MSPNLSLALAIAAILIFAAWPYVRGFGGAALEDLRAWWRQPSTPPRQIWTYQRDQFGGFFLSDDGKPAATDYDAFRSAVERLQRGPRPAVDGERFTFSGTDLERIDL